MGPQESMTRARAAWAVWNPKARRTINRTRWLSPSRRALVRPRRMAARIPSVGADGAAGFDERFQSGALHPGAPAVRQLGGFVVGESAGEDGTQGFFALVGAPQCPSVASDRFEGGGLGVGEVTGVL